MMEPISEETIAMNTASISAVSTKLNPSGRSRLIVVTTPESTEGIIIKEHINDTSTQASAHQFLKVSESLPKMGSRKEPRTGTNIVSMMRSFIFIYICYVKKLKRIHFRFIILTDRSFGIYQGVERSR
jgi:hypothetical protein